MSDVFTENLRDWDAQREQRLEMGDDLAAPRQVDHAVLFRKKSAGQAAVADFEAAGFTVTLTRGFRSATLEASRVDALTDARVAELLREAIAIAQTHGGLYDGFGAPVVDGPESL
ncbi:ribonuclease E inhibitor RraB [Dermacoccaceae bacterium W4C1]